jgi:hypothetical protein
MSVLKRLLAKSTSWISDPHRVTVLQYQLLMPTWQLFQWIGMALKSQEAPIGLIQSPYLYG